jgi:hypothetical protein
MGGMQAVKGHKFFLIRFDQKAEDQKYTSWKGKIYLDSASLAFVKITYGISPKGRGLRTLPWELAWYARVRKGISGELVVHDVTIEYDTSGNRWALKNIEWMDVMKWQSTRKPIPGFQMKVQALHMYTVIHSETNRSIDRTKFFNFDASFK